MQKIEKNIMDGYSDGSDVDGQLNRLLGVDSQVILVEALNRAIAKWRGALTLNHPATAKGDEFYNHSVVAIRELLKPFGFQPFSKNNVQFAVNYEKGIGIYCCRGDEESGVCSGRPSSLRKRGDCTLSLLGLSEDTDPTSLDLFPNIPESASLDFDPWVLLTYIDQGSNRSRFRAELSHPKSHTKGFINDFDKRIILNTMPEELVEEKSVSESFNDDIDFELSDKKA